MRIIEFFDGQASPNIPSALFITCGAIVTYADSDGTLYVADKGSPATEGNIYFSTTEQTLIMYTSGGWKAVGGGVTMFQEKPIEGVDGIRVAFSVTKTPASDESIIAVINGNIHFYTDDFTVSGTTVTFNTPPVSGSDVYFLYLTDGTVASGTIAVNRVFTHEVTPAEAIAKEITLPSTPSEPTKLLLFLQGGSVQLDAEDYSISGTTLSWSGLGMDLLPIASGAKFRIQYFE